MNDNAAKLHEQHTLKTKNNVTIENSESNSSFKYFDFDSNSVLEQLWCFSPATPVQTSDSDPEYLPSKRTPKSSAHADHPKSTCRRSARLSTVKDETSANLLPLPFGTLKDPEYLPPKGILNALKKTANELVPKSEIITNVKQRKLRRSKKIVDPACGSCNNNNHEKSSMNCNKVKPLVDFGMTSSPLSTEQLRQILEDSTFEEVSKETPSKKDSNTSADQKVLPEEVINHDSNNGKEDHPPLKMPRTRSSLKLKVKKKDVSNSDSLAKNNNEVSDTGCSQYKVSKDVVLPKPYHKESKKVLKKRKRQTCRKQFRHKDITLYKLGADPDPVNEATQKNHAIHKIFLRRSSVGTPPSTPQATSKVIKHEEVSENLSSNANSANGDNKCYETFTANDNSGLKIINPNCDLNNSNKIYSSSISSENHNMNKVPKVILTPINTKDSYYQKSATFKDNREVPQLQIKHQKTQDINAHLKKGLVSQNKPTRNEVGKHNLPIRIPERRTSIAEPLRTPPASNNKVPSFQTECQPENQFHYMKIEIKNGLSDNQEVIFVKPPSSQDKLPDITKYKETVTEPTTIVAPSMVSIPLNNEAVQNSSTANKEHLNTKENNNLPVIINDASKIISREVVSNVSTKKLTNNRGNNAAAETTPQETLAGIFSGPQNLSIKVVKSCSGITDPLKLHKTGNPPSKKIDNDAKGKVNSVTPAKDNNGNSHQRPEDPRRSVSQTIPPPSLNELPHKNSPILQQNLLNGPLYKSDIYRNNFHNRSNISLNNFNSELSSYALNSLAMNHLRTPQSNTVPSVSRNMPIIEETSTQAPNDNVSYEPFPSTSPFATDSSKKNKKTKRKLSRSDTYDEIAPKLQRVNNYSNYPGYNYPLSFYSSTPPNPSYNPLSNFPLPIPPHSVYNISPSVYQPKPTNSTGQSATFDRTNFRNMIPPQPSIINPFLAHDPPLSAPTYVSPNPPVSKPYDPRLHYNHFMRFTNPMFMNHNTLPPPDYSCIGINNRRNETFPQNSNSILQQGFNYSAKNPVRNTPRQSPHQIFTVPENTHRRSVEAIEPQNTPLALIKSSTPTQCSDWSNIPISSRNEELTITKLPLRETLPKPNHTLEKTCSPANLIEGLTTHTKQPDVRQNSGSTCSISAISKNNAKHTDSSGHPCSISNASERRSGVASVLHGEVANVSISIIKNKNEKPNKLASVPQQGLLPILERAKLFQGEQCTVVSETAKVSDVHYSKPHPTPVQNIPPIATLNLQKSNPKVHPIVTETNKNVADEKLDNVKTTIINKSPISSNIYRDVELEINCTKITKPLKSSSVGNPSFNNTPPINYKPAINNNNSGTSLHSNPEPKVENKILLNRKVAKIALPLDKSPDSVRVNSERKLNNESLSVVTILSDTDDLDPPKTVNKAAEAINLSIDKLVPVSSPKMVSQKESAPVVDTASGTTTENSTKSDSVNTIASMMQDIIHEGDVKKFDQYVETLRRSIENREMHTLDALQQNCADQFLKKIPNDVNASNSDNTIERKSAESPKKSTPGRAETEVVCLIDSETISPPETVQDLTKTGSPLEAGNTTADDCPSKPEDNSTNATNSQKPASNEPINKTEAISEHLDTNVVNRSGSEHNVSFETILTRIETPEPINLHSSARILIDTSVNIAKSVPETAVANEQTDQIVAISEDTNSQKDTEDSRSVGLPRSVVGSENVTSIENSRTRRNFQSTETALAKNILVNNTDNISASENSSGSTLVTNPAASKDAAENTTAATELLNIEIKQEIDEDDDVIFVSDSRLKATSMEDKGIQADITTPFPINSDSNNIISNVVLPKRKKWKFFEGNNSKICKSRTQRKRKAKYTFQPRNRKKSLLAKQYISKSSEFTVKNIRFQNAKTKTLSKHSDSGSVRSCKNDGSRISKTSMTTSKKPLQNTANKVSSDGSQISKTTAATTTKPCQITTNNLTSDNTQSMAVKHQHQTVNFTASNGSQMSKTAATTATNSSPMWKASTTKPYQKTGKKLSDSGTQTSKTTKPFQNTTNKLSGVGSQISKAPGTATKPYKTVNNNPATNVARIIKTKQRQTTTSKLHDNESQIRRTPTYTSRNPSHEKQNPEISVRSATLRPCQTITNELLGDGSQNCTTTSSSNSCQTNEAACPKVLQPNTNKNSDASPQMDTASPETSKFTTNEISDNGSNTFDTSTTASATPSQAVNNTFSANGSRMSKSKTSCQNTNRKRSGDVCSKRNKNPKASAVNKRISKRLLLKKGIKTYSKAENALLLSPNNEEVIQPKLCTSTVPELPPTHKTAEVNYKLRNSEIIQNRCFVRLSRIQENSKIIGNDASDSKEATNTDGQITPNKTGDVSSVDTQPNSNLIQKTLEVPTLERTSTKISDRKAFCYGYRSNKPETINEDLLSLSLPSIHTSKSSKFENSITNKSVKISENVPHLLPATNQALSTDQLSSPNRASGVISNSYFANSGVLKMPLQTPPENISPPQKTINNNSVLTPQISPCLNIQSEVVVNSPTDLKRQGDGSTETIAETTPQESPSLRSPKDRSNFSRTNNLAQMADKSWPQVVCPVTKSARDDHASPESVKLPQASHPPDQVSEKILNNSTKTQQQLPSLRETPANTTNTIVSGNHATKDFVRQSIPISHLSEDVDKFSSANCKVSSERTVSSIRTTQISQKSSHSEVAGTSSAIDANTDNSPVKMAKKSPPLSELSKHIPYSKENIFNETTNRSMPQFDVSRISSHVSDISPAYNENTVKKFPQVPVQLPCPSRSSSGTVETVTTSQGYSHRHVNNSIQVLQQTQHLSKISQQPIMSLPITSNNDNQMTTTVVEMPQKSPSVIKTPHKSYDFTTNAEPKQYPGRISSNFVGLPEKSMPESCNTYNKSLQLPKSSPNRTVSHNYSVEMSQKSPSLPKSSPHSFGSNYQVPVPYKTPTLNRTSPQISVNNSLQASPNSLFLNSSFPHEYSTSSTTYRNINSELGSNKSVQVPPKSSSSTSNMFQQTYSTTPTDFYRYGNNTYQLPHNSTPISQQTSSCPQISPSFASTSSNNNNSIQIPQKTVGRTSYQISKTPPTAHRRSNMNKVTNNSVQMQQPPLSNSMPSHVATGASDPYTYRSRNAECEIDLTISAKSASREDATNQLQLGKTLDPKISKRNLSCQDEEPVPSISSDPSCGAYQPYVPVHTDSTQMRLYLQKCNETRAQNDFAKKIQLKDHPTAFPFPTNQQEMRQNSYSSLASSNSQFSPTFRQPPAMPNNLYTKGSKQDIQAKNKDLNLTNAALRQHSAVPPLEQNNLCEIQSPSTGTPSNFKDPKEKYLTLETEKKRPKEDQNYLNRKAHEAHHFNGNLSPDYGYFSPLSKNAPPNNLESIVYRPNPIRYNEANSLHNIKYGGIPTPQHTPMIVRETYPLPNNAAASSSAQNSSNSTYVTQNSKLPSNTATLPMANGVEHKVQQPDVDKISSILPKLQQSGTLNPEQYVLEMNVLEKDGCPRPFLEFYSFVTKKQIASYQLPISFRIFLEFHNAGKLKNFENAFRIYSERHEKEKTMLKPP